MSLRNCLITVLNTYLQSNSEPFSGHSLANFIRHDLCQAVADIADTSAQLTCKGSAGQGQWTKGPWVGIFNNLVTQSAQTGYYPVYLFREDMRGVYLSLNQGMTEAKNLYKSDAKTALRARAANFRAMLGEQYKQFPELTIDLAPSSPSNDTAFYEAGNICAAYYPADHMPDDAKLASDLSAMIELYDVLIYAVAANESPTSGEGDEPPNLNYEDASKFRMHKRIERNARLIKEVKKIHGYQCQVCNTDFSKKYGEIGTHYIEAHHLTPLSQIKGKKVLTDPKKDFAVLCANCHRMIHRSGCVGDIQMFKKEHYIE